MTGAFTDPPADRPPLDLSQITREQAEAMFKKLPPGDVAAALSKLRKAVAQANSQKALIDTTWEVVKFLLKAAVV